MAERPNDIMNWQGRQFDSYGPNFSIEAGNPEMGMDGETVYNIHGISPKTGDKSLIRMSSDGTFKIMNDQQIEFNAGQNGGGGIAMIAMNGQISITADGNGHIKISTNGKGDITLDGQNIYLNARDNIKLDAKNRIDFVAMCIHRTKAFIGNLRVKKGWGGRIAVGTLMKPPIDGQPNSLLGSAAKMAIKSQTGGLLGTNSADGGGNIKSEGHKDG